MTPAVRAPLLLLALSALLGGCAEADEPAVEAAADGMRARARAESLDGEALRAELRASAQQALAVLGAYAERQAIWTSLLAAAAEAEQIADSGIAARKGGADELFSLARRAQEVRLRELAWREEAGRAGCSLLAATGVRPEQLGATLNP